MGTLLLGFPGRYDNVLHVRRGRFLCFVLQSLTTFKMFKIDEAKVYLCVCVSLTSDSSETVEVIIIKLGTVTASDMVTHHMLSILTLTFIQGHTDLNHENNKDLIISETVQAIPIHFAVKIVCLMVYIIFSQSVDFALHSRSQLHLKLDKCLTCTITATSQTVFKLWHSNLA